MREAIIPCNVACRRCLLKLTQAKEAVSLFLISILFLSHSLLAQSVGIGTNTPHPTALLHVDLGISTSNGLLVTGIFSGASTFPNLGAGSRLMFYPGKSAFRSGSVAGSQWDNSNVGFNSIACGSSTTASGNSSIAFGGSTIASGTDATAMGRATVASGLYSSAFGSTTTATGQASSAFGSSTSAIGNTSTAMGFGTNANGDYSTAMGYNTSAEGNYSFSTGYFTSAGGESSTAMGAHATASGIYSFALGDQATASGTGSISIGFNTIARGISSTAIGNFAQANGYSSTTLGFANIAKGFGSTVLGMYNDSILFSDQSSITPTTPLFIIGNGDASNNRSNALVVRKDGRVGIGTNTPDFLLDVNGRIRIASEGGSVTAGTYLNKLDNSGTAAFIGMYNDNYVGLYGSIVGWNFVMNTSSGNVGIGTLTPAQKLSVAGNICYTGTIAACSDIRYKKNILPISHALSNLITLHGIYYNWKKEKFTDKGFTDERQIGFSAQEVEKLFPEMVQTDADGYKSVDYSRMTPVLVEAIKEQQKQIEELKKKVEKLEKSSRKK